MVALDRLQNLSVSARLRTPRVPRSTVLWEISKLNGEVSVFRCSRWYSCIVSEQLSSSVLKYRNRKYLEVVLLP